MIPIEREPKEFDSLPSERCCLCKAPTRYWHTPLDVAVCPACAQSAEVEQLPTKEQWLRSESFAASIEAGWD